MGYQLRPGGKNALNRLAEEVYDFGPAGSSTSAPSSSDNTLQSLISGNRTVRRPELRKLVPLSDTTIYELERRGEFPKRFYLTPKCVVWPLMDVLEWIEERRLASQDERPADTPVPDVHRRKARPTCN